MKEIKTLEDILAQKQQTEERITSLIRDFLNSNPTLNVLNADYFYNPEHGTIHFKLNVTL